MVLTIHPSEYDLFIGLDVDKKSYAVTYMDHNLLRRSLKMSAHPENLHRYFQKRFPEKRLFYVYEAGPTGYGLHDYLVRQKETCMMVHPAGVPIAPNAQVKTNRLDSEKLAEQAKAGILRGIRVPGEPYRQLRHLVSLRDSYARNQRRIKQRIRSLLLFENICLPEELEAHPWSVRYRQALHEIPLNPTLRFKLDLLLKDLDQARDRLLIVHRQTREFCGQHESIQKNLTYLRSIPGIGPIVSTYLLARIGDPVYLKNIRGIGAFSGLVPSEHSTGEDRRKGPITHMGDSTLRSLLIQAAWAAITKDRELAQFYLRLRSWRKGQAGSQIAIVAVARKLTHRIYRVLKDQRLYVTR